MPGVSFSNTALPGGTSSVWSVARSGLQAAQTRLDVAAHNIANVNTEGAVRQTVQAQPLPGGGVQVQTAPAAEPGPQLVQDVVDQMAASQAFVAQVQVLKTAERLNDALLNRNDPPGV